MICTLVVRAKEGCYGLWLFAYQAFWFAAGGLYKDFQLIFCTVTVLKRTIGLNATLLTCTRIVQNISKMKISRGFCFGLLMILSFGINVIFFVKICPGSMYDCIITYRNNAVENEEHLETGNVISRIVRKRTFGHERPAKIQISLRVLI